MTWSSHVGASTREVMPQGYSSIWRAMRRGRPSAFALRLAAPVIDLGYGLTWLLSPRLTSSPSYQVVHRLMSSRAWGCAFIVAGLAVLLAGTQRSLTVWRHSNAIAFLVVSVFASSVIGAWFTHTLQGFPGALAFFALFHLVALSEPAL